MSKKPELKSLPALDVDAINVGRIGTAIWAVVAAAAWIFDLRFGGVWEEFPEIATVGFALGLIGWYHVSRRARILRERKARAATQNQ
ncbi:MAG: hypothetical protein RL038_486 [Actinomycetota bacterium]